MFRIELRCFASTFASLLMLAGCVSAASDVPVPEASRRGTSPLLEQPDMVFSPVESSGLFVGIRSYDPQKTGLPEVRFAVDDAVDLAYLFALELRLVAPARVQLLLSGHPEKDRSRERLFFLTKQGTRVTSASHSDVVKALDDQRKVGAAGILIVAFASHGMSEEGVDYLLTADSVDGHLSETSVNVNRILDTVAGAKAGMKIMLFDSCRAVQTRGLDPDPDFSMSERFAHALKESEGEIILSASRPHGYAYEDGEHENGVFTAAVLDGLHCQAKPDSEGDITAEQLATYVNQRVTAWVQQHWPHAPAATRGIESRMRGNAARLPLVRCSATREPQPSEIPEPKPSTLDANCEGAQLESVEIHTGPGRVYTIVPPKAELDLQLEDLQRLQNLSGKALLSRNGIRVESCPCRWEQLDPQSGGWLELEGERNACTFSLRLSQTAPDIVLHLTAGNGLPTQILLHVR